MRPASAFPVLVLLAFGIGMSVGLGACQREPAIVVRFEPPDLAGRDLARPHDLALATADAGEVAAKAAAAAKLGPVCRADAECVLVLDGCCDCANGGSLVPALKRNDAKLAAAHRAACKSQMCTMMIGTDAQCGLRAACVQGHCGSRAARADELRIPKLHHD